MPRAEERANDELERALERDDPLARVATTTGVDLLQAGTWLSGVPE